MAKVPLFGVPGGGRDLRARGMKVVKMRGGLGNQLFCLAFARSVALLTGAPVGLDLAPFGNDPYGRAYLLGEFADELGLFRSVRRPARASPLAGVVARIVSSRRHVREGVSPADAGALAALVSRGSYFDGYWQDEAYLADAEGFRDRVRALVTARSSAAGNPPIGEGEVVIHYRTYKEERRAAARRTPPPAFFREAVARIAAAGPVGEIALVSDDPMLALARLGDLGAPVRPVSGTGPWQDLALMRRAKSLILSNSSFSWWGGFCAETDQIFYPRPDGYVHYPIPARRFTRL
jgi:hypothetical protein